MKHSFKIAAGILLATALPAFAEDAPTTKGPPVTMGDEGKLPATGTISNKVPEMGAAPAPAPTGESTSVKGPPVTMGDQGKLPATGTVSGAVPQMTGPDATKK
jgi:hypothetical protein